MKFTCNQFKNFADSADFLQKRLVFQTPEGPKNKPAEADKPKENDAGKEQDQANAALDKNKQDLQKKIDANINSSDPAIKAAAEKAQADLKKLEGSTDKNLDAVQVQQTLDTLNKTLEYNEKNTQLEGLKKDVHTQGEALKKSFIDDIKAKRDSMLKDLTGPAEHIQIATEFINGLTEEMIGEDTSEVLGGIEVQLLSVDALNPTLDDYMKSSKSMDDAITSATKSLDALKSTDSRFGQEIILKTNTFEDKCTAILFTEAAKDADTAIKNVDDINDGTQQILNEISKQRAGTNLKDYYTFANQLTQNTKAAMGMLSPKDAEKRAVILADFNDKMNRMLNSVRLDEDKQPPTDTLTPTLEANFIKKDSFAKAIGKGTEKEAPAKWNLEHKVDEEHIFVIKGTPRFRLEDSGITVATLKPGTKVQVLDTSLVHVVDENGKQAVYARVQVDPPNGAEGLVPVAMINMNKSVGKTVRPREVDLDAPDTQEPPKPGSPA